jgi:peptidoglycan/LPS O-acetylase OafA/YrhL
MNRLQSVQIMRGAAASLVVVDHAILRQAEWGAYPWTTQLTAMHMGAFGVHIFFVISGFIMVHTSYDSFGKEGAPSHFMARRLARIVPLYWIATATELTLRAIKGAPIDPTKVLYSLLFIPQSVDPSPTAAIRPVLAVGWTLDYEMFFYVIFAVALLWERRIGIGVLVSTMLALVLAGTLLKPLTDTSDPITTLAFWTNPTILLFLAGALLAVAWKARAAAARFITAYPLPICAALIAWTVWIFPQELADLSATAYQVPLAWRLVFWGVCVALIALCVFGRPVKVNWFTAPLIKLGDASYSIYLFHTFVVVATEKVWWALDPPLPAPFFLVAAFFTSAAAGIAIHHLIETPIERWLRVRLIPARSRTGSGAGASPLRLAGKPHQGRDAGRARTVLRPDRDFDEAAVWTDGR